MSESRASYDARIIEATEAEMLDGTAWPHLNPNYEGRELPEPSPLLLGVARSRYHADITPGWLVQEALHRGSNGVPSLDGIFRLMEIERSAAGWEIVARMVDDSPASRYFVSDAEAEAGEGGTLLGEVEP